MAKRKPKKATKKTEAPAQPDVIEDLKIDSVEITDDGLEISGTARRKPAPEPTEPRKPVPATKEQAAALTRWMVAFEALNDATAAVGVPAEEAVEGNPFVDIVAKSSLSTDAAKVGVPIFSPDQIQQLRVRVSAAKHDTEQAASLLAALSQALPILLAL